MAIVLDNIGLTNEDLRKIRMMRPGTPVDLQVTSASTTKRVRTEFVGMDGTRCMIIRFPDESKWGSLRDAIYTENTLVVRYILEDDTGEIIAFKVKVTLILTKPTHLIFTTFPLAIQSHDLRAEQRAQTRIAVSLCDNQSGSSLGDCIVRDLSLKGCRISIDKSRQGPRPAVKQQIKMQFADAAQGEYVLVGTIMNNKADEVSLFYGIRFETAESEVAKLMQKLMLALN
jgi:hypothetical protein